MPSQEPRCLCENVNQLGRDQVPPSSHYLVTMIDKLQCRPQRHAVSIDGRTEVDGLKTVDRVLCFESDDLLQLSLQRQEAE
jgi:hypothetical protein